MSETKKRTQFNPYLAVLAGVLAVSFSSLFVKLSSASPVIIAAYRMLFSFLLITIYNLTRRISFKKEMTRTDILWACASGFLLAMHFFTWFSSLKYTSVASSVVLVTTQPVFVVIGSIILFKEKISQKAAIGGIIALAGSVFISSTDFQTSHGAFFGDLLAIFSAILVSGYLLIGRRLRSRISVNSYTFVTYGFSSLVLMITAVMTGTPFYPYPMREWVLFLSLAVICTLFGHTIFNWALRYVKASFIAVSILGEPLGAIFWAFIFLAEQPTSRQLLGSAVILTGLIIFTRIETVPVNTMKD